MRFPQGTAFQGPVSGAAEVRNVEGPSANGNFPSRKGCTGEVPHLGEYPHSWGLSSVLLESDLASGEGKWESYGFHLEQSRTLA